MKPEVKEEQKKNQEKQEEQETVKNQEAGGPENGANPEKDSREKAKAESNPEGEENAETGNASKDETDNEANTEANTDEADREAGPQESDEESASGGSIKGHPEYKELQDKYMRLYAEFENYRRRTAKESMELVKTANAELLEKLIPVLENFALAFSPDRKAQKLEDFEKGVKMIYNSLKDVCDEVGLEEIHPEGEEFDPNLHEALMEQHHEKVPEGHVIQVFQKGYQLQSKILKHAKVITSKGPEKKEDVKKEG